MQKTLLDAIKKGLVKSAHDCSEGGLGIAIAECCLTNREKQLGAEIKIDDSIRTDCLLFGETQSRVVVSCAEKDLDSLLSLFASDKIPCKKIGVVGGQQFKINELINLDLSVMDDAYFNTLPKIMERML
ncbi:MAG: hypothetical protein GXO93_07505 [FCB group bacterium]|nr:hypothetical protein [FCB group bacterium]